jgi:hypothetical protein
MNRILIGIMFCAMTIGANAETKVANEKPSDQKAPTVLFKVTAQDGINVSILVPKAATNAQLKELVFELSCARKQGRMGKLGISPTSLGGSFGAFGIVQAYLFDDSGYSSMAKLKKFVKSDQETASEKSFAQDFTRKIRAFYRGAGSTENATFGYDDNGYGKRTVSYGVIPMGTNLKCAEQGAIAPSTQTSDGQAQKVEQAARRNAKIDCEVRIEKSLHDPSSAEWLDKTLGVLEPLSMGRKADGGLEILTRLRAKNGFGAMRLFTAECNYKRKGDTYIFSSMRQTS